MCVCVCVCTRGNISLNWETGRNQQSWNVLNIVDVYRAEFVPNPHAITCRYKSYRQIKFWHDSLSWHKFQDSSRERRRDGDTDMCFILSFPRPLVSSPNFPPCPFLSLSLSLFLSFFFSLSRTWHDYLSFYIPELANFAAIVTRSPTIPSVCQSFAVLRVLI